MSFLKPLLVAAASLAAVQAHAYTYSFVSPIPDADYTAPTFSDGVKSAVHSTTLINAYLQPLGTTGTYLAVNSLWGASSGSATIDTGGVTSYSFVWGSPDPFNELDIYSSATDYVEYTGSMLASSFGFTADGDNANTGLFTITADTGETIDHLVLKSYGMAFEVAVAVPEPESYAMMLAGLGALAFMARRRARA